MDFNISAPLWKRILAFIIDTIILNFIVVFPFRPLFLDLADVPENNLAALMDFMRANEQNIIPLLLISFIIALLSLAYWVLLEFYLKQTLGKMLLKLKVKSFNKKLTFPQCLIRNISKMSNLLLILDTLYLIFSGTGQRFFDKLAKTRVVEDEK